MAKAFAVWCALVLAACGGATEAEAVVVERQVVPPATEQPAQLVATVTALQAQTRPSATPLAQSATTELSAPALPMPSAAQTANPQPLPMPSQPAPTASMETRVSMEPPAPSARPSASTPPAASTPPVPGPPKCVVDATLCNSVCGTVDDNCGGTLTCSGCQPNVSTSSYGNQCQDNVCEQVALKPMAKPSPADNALCSVDYPDAWLGLAPDASCTSGQGIGDTARGINCCKHVAACMPGPVKSGCKVFYPRCGQQPASGCQALATNGRLNDQWCCN